MDKTSLLMVFWLTLCFGCDHTPETQIPKSKMESSVPVRIRNAIEASPELGSPRECAWNVVSKLRNDSFVLAEDKRQAIWGPAIIYVDEQTMVVSAHDSKEFREVKLQFSLDFEKLVFAKEIRGDFE